VTAGSPENRDGARRHAVSRFRRNLVRLGILSSLLFIVLVFLATGTKRESAALIEVAATVVLTIAGGSAIAYQLSPDYAEVHAKASKRFFAAWGYVRGSIVWGVASASAGVLLSDALPNRIVDAFATDPNSLSIKGFMAILFGAVGVAAAFLEEWRRRLPSD
jgi:hypothetical protein